MGNAIILGSGGASVTSDDLTAMAANVLSGLTFIGNDTDDDIGTGTMTNRGAVSQALNAGGSYTIPAGYHNGSGTVTGNSLASQTSADATNAQILSGKTGYVNGAKRTGSMANNGAVSVGLNAGATYKPTAGYHNGSGKVTANSLASQTAANATAGQILNTYTGWVNGVKVTGTMANQGTKTYTINCGGSQTIPAGYHSGSGKVTVNSLASQTAANATAATIRSGYTGWVDGELVTGTLADVAGGTYTPGTSNQTLAASGKYLTSNIVVQGSSNLVAGNIKKGVTIFGITGTYVKTPCDIYNAGTFSNVSATFVSGGRINGGGTSNVSIEESTLSLYIEGSQGEENWQFGRTAAITLTGNYTKLSMVATQSQPRHGGGDRLIGISTSSSISALSKLAKYQTLENSSVEATTTVNISGLKGTYYVFIGVNVRDDNFDVGSFLSVDRIYFSV